MKKTFFILIFFFSLLSCGGSDSDDTKTPENPEADKPTVGTEWIPVFEENFDSDLSKWSLWNTGAYNNEIQLYQPEQLNLENGILSISAERKSVTGETNPYDSTSKTFKYTSGRMETKLKFGPSYGQDELEYRFMARIQLPKGHGMWPAFWSTSDPWPTNGEIDIIEARGSEPKKFQSNIFYGVEVNKPLTNNTTTVKEYNLDVDLTEDFHIYELIWTANTLVVRFDDVTLHTYNANSTNYIDKLFGKKQHIVLNVAVGGWFFTDTNDANFADSGVMKVDWVKVYKR